MPDLKPHPDYPPHAVERVSSTLVLDRGALSIDVCVSGDLGLVELDYGGGGARRDGLWKSTCFELFLRPQGGVSYFEVNLAPSGDWATYAFDDYRKGMQDAPLEPRGEPFFLCDGFIFEMVMSFEWGGSAGPAGVRGWEAALSAIIEEIDGTKSYWALAHPPGKPDFHHPDCFALELPPSA
jgi:hypothetical protein